eukprot:144717-Rhodomonas_salina.1
MYSTPVAPYPGQYRIACSARHSLRPYRASHSPDLSWYRASFAGHSLCRYRTSHSRRVGR